MLWRKVYARQFTYRRKKIAAIDIDPDEDALLIIQENKKPAIAKLNTGFKMAVAGIEIGFTIGLDDLIDVVRKYAA